MNVPPLIATVIPGLRTLAAQRPELEMTLPDAIRLLDVGTDVRWIAVDAARAWPGLRGVGIDPWEPALALARKELLRSGVVNQVQLRLQKMEHLNDVEGFAVALLSGLFISIEVADLALPRIHPALTRGGWLIFGVFAPASTSLEEPLTRLRVVQCGGHPYPPEVEAKLNAFGFKCIESAFLGLPVHLVVGRRATS